jgi:hypothetical protein
MAVDDITMENSVVNVAPAAENTVVDTPRGDETKPGDIGVDGTIADGIAADGVCVDADGVTTSSSCLRGDIISSEITAENKVPLTYI